MITPKYKVVIPCAGIGQRLAHKTSRINKALITVGNKPAICHVIEKFPESCEIVIILGYKGDQVKEVVSAFYPKRSVVYVDVDKFEGPGSGLGYSLLKAKEHLNCPFIFVPNDSLVVHENIALDPTSHGNWLAYYKKQTGDGFRVSNYRTITKLNDDVVNINSKGIFEEDIYIGICGVLDHNEFWQSMIERAESIEVGEAMGLSGLKTLRAVEIKGWYDCGSLESLEIAQAALKNPEMNILDKEDEAIWFADGTVIKFSVDQDFISDRLKRLENLPTELFPKIINSGNYFYQYNFLEGSVFSSATDVPAFLELLEICWNELWRHKPNQSKDPQGLVEKFYRLKTEDRLRHYLKRYEQKESEILINGVAVPPVEALLKQVDWLEVSEKTRFSRFHGDLHGENIIVGLDGRFKLIDWRQNFGAGEYEFGDTYYDLAKILHGLIVNHGQVEKGNFSIFTKGSKNFQIDILRLNSLVSAERALRKWCDKTKYDFQHVKLITALIYINICGLHDWPYAQFLYLLGRSELYKCLLAEDY